MSISASLFSNRTASESGLDSRAALSSASMFANVALSIAVSAGAACSDFFDGLLGLDDMLLDKKRLGAVRCLVVIN